MKPSKQPRPPGSALPKNWLSCPKYSAPIANLFIASKAFVDAANFDARTPELLRYTPMYIREISMRFGVNIRLVIDLSNTDRFYNSAFFKSLDIDYLKIRCSGHDQPPEQAQVDLFVAAVDDFLSANDDDSSYILVHCTHGFNRTGYMICSFLISNYKMTVGDSVEAFKEVRWPGIYKQDYIDQLLHHNLRFEKTVYEIEAEKKIEYSNDIKTMLSLFDENSSFLPLPQFADLLDKKNSKFCFDYVGICSVSKLEQMRVAAKVQVLTDYFRANEFVGSQPVSLSTENVYLLNEMKYQVSWKADGTRYIMYVENHDNVFMIDRDNAVFRVPNLFFTLFSENENEKRFLTETIFDGEMVEDRYQNQRIPRYLVYDTLIFDRTNISGENFTVRFNTLKKVITDFKKKPSPFNLFSIRPKDFFDIKKTQWLTEQFCKSLTHENDGLIFQPVDAPYKLGKCRELLKWKPGVLNTVDFKLVLDNRPKKGCVFIDSVPGYLYVGGQDKPFDKINVPLSQTKYDNKIVECQLFDFGWRIMRDRPDKSFPNHVTTAVSVLGSIKNHLHLQHLYKVIYEG